MSKNFSKLSSWGGKNKNRVRLNKLHDVATLKNNIEWDLIQEGLMNEGDNFYPRCLTFAGTRAIFERLLVNHNLTTPDNILTVQTYEKLSKEHNGKEIIKRLIRARSDFLSGMKIWPYNFFSFSKCYKADGHKATCSRPSSSLSALWNKAPYKGLMDTVVNKPPNKFSVMDLDLCGVFSQKNADSITNLFKTKALSSEGVLFITHLKGRDVRGGNLFKILLKELDGSKHIDFNSIRDRFEENPTHFSRYVLIPLYYINKAFNSGYVLEFTKLIEYRDKNKNTGLAPNMLQYFFNWVSIKDSKKDANRALYDNLCSVMDEEYQYLYWVN